MVFKDPGFVPRKACLPPGLAGERVVLSKDLNAQGAKAFAVAPSVEAAVRFLRRNTGHNFYEVVEDATRPVRAFFDVDRPGTEFGGVSSSSRHCFKRLLAKRPPIHDHLRSDVRTHVAEPRWTP
jgi:hypothetical protein